jgi:hypothetical protein
MSEVVDQVHLLLTGDVSVSQPGEFEIIAISAGRGNGWLFTSECLQSSIPLWDGVDCYVDHEFQAVGRSVRDLAGICYSPSYDPDSQSIRVKLKTSGPSGPFLEAVGREWLASPDPKPGLGFSADILFSASDTQVVKIIKVISLDIVMTPARGGAFVRALNQKGHVKRRSSC